jgi:hypothetical protein
MRIWPAHFTPAMKAADLLALRAAGYDRDVMPDIAGAPAHCAE